MYAMLITSAHQLLERWCENRFAACVWVLETIRRRFKH